MFPSWMRASHARREPTPHEARYLLSRVPFVGSDMVLVKNSAVKLPWGYTAFNPDFLGEQGQRHKAKKTRPMISWGGLK